MNEKNEWLLQELGDEFEKIITRMAITGTFAVLSVSQMFLLSKHTTVAEAKMLNNIPIAFGWTASPWVLLMYFWIFWTAMPIVITVAAYLIKRYRGDFDV